MPQYLKITASNYTQNASFNYSSYYKKIVKTHEKIIDTKICLCYYL